MHEAKRSQHRRGKRFSISSMITLVSWRLRQTWFLLTITTIGIIAAVIIVCVVPLFSDVMTTAGLHNTLRQDPYSSEFEIDATTQGLSTPVMHDVQGQIATLFKQNLGALAAPSQYLLQSSDFTFSSLASQRQLSAYATSMQQAKAHFTHLQGRVPVVTSTPGRSIEVMLSSESAKLLKIKVGSVLPLTWSYYPTQTDPNVPQLAHAIPITAHVVGIFDVSAADVAYWHGESFAHLTFPVGKITQYTYKIVLSDTALLAIADSLRTPTHADAIYSASYGYSLHWYYRLDVTHITINDLDNLIYQISTLQSAFATQYADISPGVFRGALDYPYLTKVDLSSELLSVADTPSTLENFRSRYAVSRIPVLVMTIQIIALILFFVSLMTNLLIDRQSDALVLLRSRGASSGQIFGTLLIQSLLLGVLAIIIGLPLTIVTVLALARALLPKVQQDALQLVTSQPLQAMENLAIYAVSIVLIVLLTMSVSQFLIARMDVLSMRREQTRSSKRPLWQRMNLDIIAGVVALVGYGISLYLTGLGSVLQGDAKALITTPLSIIAPFFLVIGCMLLFLRVFPLLLRLASHIAARGRGAVSMLAFAQVSRSPRQPLRMTMLLALSIAFTLFTLVYMATQSQHIQDIVTYQAGADFSGDIASNTSLNGSNVISNANSHDPTTLLPRYKAIPGVVSASAGFISQGTAGNAALPIVLRAVDATTFGNTVIWSTTKDQQTASSLLKDLASRQQSALKTLTIPAIVDTTTMKSLHLSVGSHFKLKIDNQVVDTVQCVVMGSVSHVPTVNDRTAQLGTQGFMSVGGILVDYKTYININLQVAKESGVSLLGQLNIPTLNHIWLRSRDDAGSVNSIRTSIKLPGLSLQNIVDRRALLATLNADPPYLILSGILRIGTVTALLLALLGNLLASWLTARTRLGNFAVMRALGTSPARVASILMWEQGIVYVIGLLLGIAFGALLSATVIPSLTLSSVNTNLSSAQFFDLQTAFPTVIVVPPTLPLALFVLVAIYVVALLMMVRVVSRPSLGQTLRLNED